MACLDLTVLRVDSSDPKPLGLKLLDVGMGLARRSRPEPTLAGLSKVQGHGCVQEDPWMSQGVLAETN